MDALPLVIGLVLCVVFILAVRWLVRQAELRGQSSSQIEVARLTERIAAAEQAIRSRDQRIESLEETDAHRQLYVKTELEKAALSHALALRELSGERDAWRQQYGDLRAELATQTAEVTAATKRADVHAAEAAEVPRLRTALQTVSENYARGEEISVAQAATIQGLQSELAGTKQELRIVNAALQGDRTRLAELQEQLQHGAELKAALHQAEGDRAALNTALAEASKELGGLTADVMHLRDRVAAAEDVAQKRDLKLAEQQSAFERSLAEQERSAQLQSRIDQLEGERDSLRRNYDRAAADLSALNAELTAERQQTEEKLKLLSEAKDQLGDQFRTLAAEILQHNTQQFAEQNQARLGDLLNPLKEQLTHFQSKVEQVHHEGAKERAGLYEQVKGLSLLNQTLSDDARSLTKALKGESKVQGDWGEMILERVLELSGLREGEEYFAQKSHSTEEGGQLRPDVVINLPDSKCLMVDAKVSLKAYEAYSRADTDAQRDQYFKQHLESIRGHIRGLAEKNYPALPGANAIAFVVMFVPLEPAFALAMSRDSSIWQEAWKRNVMLVSPSTLMFVVRTVSHLWQQESQTRNSREIARQGASIYDKLVGFLEDMDRLGRTLEKANESYHGAVRKLSTGKGNLIGQADKLKKFGVPATKALPDHYQTILALDDSDEPEPPYQPLEAEAARRPQ